jgi:hypothetical protein
VTQEVEVDQDAVNERLSDAYREAVGSVTGARTLYDEACAAHGTDSWPARQARDYLDREVAHRNALRDQYDQVIDQRPRY